MTLLRTMIENHWLWMFEPEFNFQAFPEHVPCLRLVRVVQLLPAQDDDVDEDDIHDDVDIRT